jgi:Papain family cysteine protease
MGKSAQKSGKSSARGGGKLAQYQPQRTTAEARATRPAATGPIPSDAMAVPDRSLNRIQVGNRRFPAEQSTLGTRKLDILPDMPDIRDRIYRPILRALEPAIYPRIAFSVRDQGKDSSCTGFIRGAITGFFRNGVCREATAPDSPEVKNWSLTYEMAKEARETRLGAYLRLEPDISDYHAALNELGVIYASAQIHSNWDSPRDGYIEPGGKSAGGHAFAIVGYDDKGFWILNSWGPTWGTSGIAHWHYVDWAANIMDAWVLQLGVRAPDAFGAVPRVSPSSASGLFGFGDPNRSDIIGHFINIDDGRLVTDGKYGSPSADEMHVTVERLTSPQANKGNGYEHLIIYAHGGLNSLPDEAKRIAIWKQGDIFGRNQLYNFHLMWGSGFIDEVFGELSESPVAGRAAGRFSDWLFEAGFGKETGSYAWRNMKQDAQSAFGGSADYDGGFKGLMPLLGGLDKAPSRPMLHLVGHSAGAIVLSEATGGGNPGYNQRIHY